MNRWQESTGTSGVSAGSTDSFSQDLVVYSITTSGVKLLERIDQE